MRGPRSIPVRLKQLRNPDCTACRLHKTTSGNKCVMGRGNFKANVCLIGEAPGREEAKTGKPFTGASGQLLSRCMREVGIDESSVFITNVARCRPDYNRRPSQGESNICTRLYLKHELAIIKPRVIVLLGRTAQKYTIGHDYIHHLNELKSRELWGRQYLAIPTYHPAYYLHTGGQRKPKPLLEALATIKEHV